MHWFIEPVTKHYFDFQGRTGRKAYWMFVLYYIIVAIAISIVGEIIGLPFIADLFGLAMLLPVLGIGARRLHDVGKSAWWLLVSLIPILGTLILIYFAVQPSDAGDNKYGANPAGVTPEAASAPSESAPAAQPAEPTTAPVETQSTQTPPTEESNS